MLRRKLLPALIVPVVLLASCGDSDGDAPRDTTAEDTDGSVLAGEDSAPDTSDTDTTGDDTNTGKPEVEIPDAEPTELVVTVLKEGSGDPAENGDTVVVDYVGVLSADGTEFDNSYDRGQTFPVQLGAGGVIAGWDQGLVGATAGSRIQLDIPGELAYGAAGSPPVIGPNAALTFVIDVRAVVPGTDPADAPTDLTPPSADGVTDLEIDVVVEGEGEAAELGDSVYVHYLAYDGEGTLVQNSWDAGGPQQLTLDAQTITVQGLLDGLVGMKAGGRRWLVVPASVGFGDEGNEQLGIGPGGTLILLVDMFQVG